MGFNIGMNSGVFNVENTGSGSAQQGSFQFRKHQADPALTAADEGVYTCRIPDEIGSNVDVNMGVYLSGFQSMMSIGIQRVSVYLDYCHPHSSYNAAGKLSINMQHTILSYSSSHCIQSHI